MNGFVVSCYELVRLVGRPVELRDRETDGAMCRQSAHCADDLRPPRVFHVPQRLYLVCFEVARRYARRLARQVGEENA